MKNLPNSLPLWSPSGPMTESENTTMLQYPNHIHEAQELDRNRCPRDSRDTHSWKPSRNSKHEERIESDINDSSDNKCAAIGFRVPVCIEDTVNRIRKEKYQCK